MNIQAIQDEDCFARINLTIDGQIIDIQNFGKMKTYTPSSHELEENDELAYSCFNIEFAPFDWEKSPMQDKYTKNEYIEICNCIKNAIQYRNCQDCV